MFHRAAGQCEGGAEVFAGGVGAAGAKLKFAERGVVEGIAGEAIGIRDGANLFEAALGAIALSDGDGAVERYDRRRTNGHQLVVERNDHLPIGVFGARRGGVNPGDGGLQVILGEFGAGGREIEQPLPFGRRDSHPIANDPDRRASASSPEASRRAGRRAACRHMSAESAYVAGVAARGCSRSSAARRMASRQSSARTADSGEAPW